MKERIPNTFLLFFPTFSLSLSLSEQAPPPVPEHHNRSHTEGELLNSSPPSLRKVDPSASVSVCVYVLIYSVIIWSL